MAVSEISKAVTPKPQLASCSASSPRPLPTTRADLFAAGWDDCAKKPGDRDSKDRRPTGSRWYRIGFRLPGRELRTIPWDCLSSGIRWLAPARVCDLSQNFSFCSKASGVELNH